MHTKWIILFLLTVCCFNNAIGKSVYDSILCNIVNDTTVTNKFILLYPEFDANKWDKRMSVSKYLTPLSTAGFESYFRSIDAKMEDYLEPIKASYGKLHLKKFKCHSENSGLKVFFSNIKNRYVSVSVAYSETYKGRDLPDRVFTFYSYVILLYKVDEEGISLKCVNMAYN